MVDCFNALGVRYVCLGNHENDVPMDALRQRIVQSRFDWINTNMRGLDRRLLRNASPADDDADDDDDDDANNDADVLTPAHVIVDIVPRNGDERDQDHPDAVNGNHGRAGTDSDHTHRERRSRGDHPSSVPAARTSRSRGRRSTTGRSIRRVAFLGLLTNDPGLYRPNAFGGAIIESVVPSAERALERLLPPPSASASESTDDQDPAVDLIIPMTHQGMNEDVEFADHFGGRRFPIVLGGHDHSVIDATTGGGSRILKAGMDAQNAIVIDILWPDDDDVDDHKRNKHRQQADHEDEGSKMESDCVPGQRVDDKQHNVDNKGQDDDRCDDHSLPMIHVQFLSTKDFPPDPDMVRRVRSHQRILRELERAPLFSIREWIPRTHPREYEHDDRTRQTKEKNDDFPTTPSGDEILFTTRDNRLGPSTGSTALTSLLRMGLRCECAIMNAGSVRGNRDYDTLGRFTWSDLKREMPFPTHMTTAKVPGSVLERTIRSSHGPSRMDPPQSWGGYLHTCSKIQYHHARRKIERINGQAFDPDREYLVAMPAQFFKGIDNHEHLLEWASETNYQVHVEEAKPAKMIIVEVFASLLWLRLGTFADLDLDGDGEITRGELVHRLNRFYHESDEGTPSPSTSTNSPTPSSITHTNEDRRDEDVDGGTASSLADYVVDSIFNVADLDGSGTITPLEMMIVQLAARDLENHVVTSEEQRTMRLVAKQVLGMEEISQKGDEPDACRLECSASGMKVPKINETEMLLDRMVTEMHRTIDSSCNGKIERQELIRVLGKLAGNATSLLE